MMLDSPTGRPTIRDFLVDLLGSLVPGVLFVFLAVSALLWPVWSLGRVLQEATPIGPQFFEQIAKTSEVFRFELVAFFIVASYVAGHFLFRQDPKNPDVESYKRTSRTFSEEEAEHWVVQKGPGEGPDDEPDVQFPYRYLREYLTSRELTHLADLVPWEGNDKSTWHKRTKSFINILKIRLMFYFPDRCGQTTRNEAHVRLMSSVWYASSTLRPIAVIGVATALVAGGVAAVDAGEFRPNFLVPMSMSLLVFLLATWTKGTVERFLHYQRVREVIFVLETAYNAAQEKPSILENLF